MTILALDLGTKTGWASEVASGTIEFKTERYAGGGMRYVLFRKWLKKTNEDLGGIDQLYFEEVRRHRGTAAAHCYGGFMAHLTAWCEENGIPYLGVPVGTIKKHATGKGNSNKDKMMEAYWEKWNDEPVDDNECDARWLLDYVQETYAC